MWWYQFSKTAKIIWVTLDGAMQKSVVNFKQEGCIFHLNGKQTPPQADWAQIFLVVGFTT